MSRYIQDPKNNKCKISVFSALTTGGTGQGRIHFSFIWNGAGQDSVPPRFRHASADFEKLFRFVPTEVGRSATLPLRFRRISNFVPFRVR